VGDEFDKNNRNTATQTEVLTSPGDIAKDLADFKPEPALVVVQGDQLGRVFRLKQGRTTIGRHPETDVLLQQRAVSGYHAEIRVSDKSVILEDLKSTNGTFHNTARLTRPVVLQPNDLIKIGASVFKYVDSKIDSDFAESLHKKTTKDAMTGAYNKEYFVKALVQSIEIAKSGYPLSLIMFDLDHFKKVNDTYGHLAGDYVLTETCRVLREIVVRSEDVLARYGGEEFAVIMPDSPLKVAVGVAERIRKTLESHDFVFEGKKIPVTSSLGVVAWVPGFATSDQMVAAADELLYKSKQGGRNRVTAMPE
jgi:diguanylate cyclase (GGDEF)-like protein